MPSIHDLKLTAEQRERLRGALARRDSRPPPNYRQSAKAGELTERELQVLRLIADGVPPPEIAGRLFITHWTVLSHIKHIRQKLGTSTQAHAVAVAFRMKLLE
jgi:DNA-binding CsgD family transcriptional regulator